MKKYFSPAIRLTLVMLVLCCGVYFSVIYLVGKATKGNGNGEQVIVNGKVVGYKLLGQKFTEDKYFWSRPSAVDYNAAGSAGSNKGPSNPDYLAIVQARIDTFLVHNPTLKKTDIPSEMVTASGSGLDPDISPSGALVQIARISEVRNIPQGKIKALVDQHTRKVSVGPDVINVLELNIALDDLK